MWCGVGGFGGVEAGRCWRLCEWGSDLFAVGSLIQIDGDNYQLSSSVFNNPVVKMVLQKCIMVSNIFY